MIGALSILIYSVLKQFYQIIYLKNLFKGDYNCSSTFSDFSTKLAGRKDNQK